MKTKKRLPPEEALLEWHKAQVMKAMDQVESKKGKRYSTQEVEKLLKLDN